MELAIARNIDIMVPGVRVDVGVDMDNEDG